MATGWARRQGLARAQAEPHRIEMLILDYEQAREDDRSLTNIQAVVFGAAIAVLGLIGAAVTQVTVHSPVHILLAGAPLLPLALFAYAELIGSQATVRSYYLRGLEAELRKHVSRPLSALGDIQPASYVGIMTEMTSLRVGRGRLLYKILNNYLFVAVLVVFGTLTVYIGVQIEQGVLRIVMLAVYGPLVGLLVWGALALSIRGRGLFIRTAKKFLSDDATHRLPIIRTPSNTSCGNYSVKEERSLRSYLIFPRPADCAKWLFSPVVFLVTAWSQGNWAHWLRFLILWLVLEYFINMARYQWNDVRGIDEDHRHAGKRPRGRLPRGGSQEELVRNIKASVIVALLRLAVAVAVGRAFSQTLPVVWLVGAVFGTAVIYESLRSYSKKCATTNQEVKTKVWRATPSVIAIWIVESFGFAIRASIGFSAGGLALASVTGVVGLACIGVCGLMFTLLVWLLEATSYCYAGRDVWYRMSGLAAKPHVAALLVYIGKDPKPMSSAPQCIQQQEREGSEGPDYCGSKRELQARGKPLAPWNWTLLIGGALGGVLGVRLAGIGADEAWLAAAVCALNAIGAIALALCASTLWRIITSTVITAVTITIALPQETSSRVLIVAIPWLLISGLYCFIRNASYEDLMKSVVEEFKQFMKSAEKMLVRLVVGSATLSTLEAMVREEPQHSPRLGHEFHNT